MEHHLKRILSYTKRYWKKVTLSVIAATLFGVFSAAPAYVIQFIVDKVFVQRVTHLLFPFILCFITLFIIKGIFMYASSYYMNWVGNRVVNDLRSDLFKKIIYFPFSFYQKKTTGELMAHFLSDITIIQNASSAAVRSGIRSLFEAACLISVAFIQNPKLSLLMLTIGPAIAVIIKKMGKYMRSTAASSQQKMGHVSSILQEMFIGIREIKSFNTEETEISRFSKYLQSYFRSIMRNVRIISATPALIEIIAMGGCGVIFYIASLQVLHGTISPGQLTSFFSAILLSYQPLKRLINVYSDIQAGIAASGRVFDVMDKTYPINQNRTIVIDNFQNSISFKNATFYYIENQPILQNINLEIKKGESIGIIGRSGSGKSTFCDLLLGFITPKFGNIYIDNQDITKISFASLRGKIGYVGQKTFLFNDSIFNNVTYANPNAKKEEVISACNAAYAHEFIERLPQGYLTVVGEDGTLLSGGQKQRITIARALLKNPEILIFDEATSSLDQKSEEIIQHALEEISKKKTVIIVSHRQSLIKKMDRILTIQNTQIFEPTAKIKKGKPAQTNLI